MATTYLTRTPSSAGSATKGTYSAWIKRGIVSSGYPRLFHETPSSTNYFEMFFKDTDELDVYCAFNGSKRAEVKTSRKFQDTLGWYHIVVAVDSSQSTAADRIKIYVNGVQETSFGTADYPGSGDNMKFNGSTGSVWIGKDHNGNYFDGIMSHVHWIDGTQYAASDFGETDSDTGEWKIKTSPSVTYGTNGFFVLKDGNSVTDQSGETNNFTVGGGTLTKTEDNPSNVFCTLNPLEYSPNPATFANGNTTFNKQSTGAGHNATVTGTIGAMTGKFYFEFKPTNTTNFVNGMVRTNHALPNSDGYYGDDAGCYGITNDGKVVAGSQSSLSYSYSANDIIGMAFDLDNGKFYAHVNGTYITSGDPTSGSTGTGSIGDIALGSNIYVPIVANANYGATNLQYFNFGNGYFGTTAISSAGTNASGIGIFEYDVPTGYTALSTKGLNE